MSLSQPIMSVLCEFESAFSQPTWRKMQVLIVGTLFARGRRTVTVFKNTTYHWPSVEQCNCPRCFGKGHIWIF